MVTGSAGGANTDSSSLSSLSSSQFCCRQRKFLPPELAEGPASGAQGGEVNAGPRAIALPVPVVKRARVAVAPAAPCVAHGMPRGFVLSQAKSLRTLSASGAGRDFRVFSTQQRNRQQPTSIKVGNLARLPFVKDSGNNNCFTSSANQKTTESGQNSRWPYNRCGFHYQGRRYHSTQ